MITFDWNVLLDLEIIDSLEDGQSMSHTRNSHLLQVIVLQSYQSLADNVVFLMRVSSLVVLQVKGSIPKN